MSKNLSATSCQLHRGQNPKQNQTTESGFDWLELVKLIWTNQKFDISDWSQRKTYITYKKNT